MATRQSESNSFRLLALTVCTIAGATLGVILWLRFLEAHLPDVRSLADVRLNPATTIVSDDGVILATLAVQDRRPISLNEVSPYVVNATIATEDARFYAHKGVDARGILRAIVADLAGGNLRGQGASTITQQLARNLYLGRQKTFTRKIEEMLLARKIERTYSKSDILEAYLNTVYYGSGCYGIEAAAQTYFGKSASKLSLGEAALLAGVPQRPTAFAPGQHLDAALRRRGAVLSRMVAAGYISEAQAEDARRQHLHILPPRPQNVISWKAPYFVSDVLTALRQRYGNEFIYSGARVQTTLNWRLQQAAETALCARLKHGIANTGALIAIAPQNGYVRALVGGPDFRRSQFDAVTQGLRQPGSAFKPIVYVTAFDSDACNLISQYQDEKLVYPNGGHDYVVHNYDGTYHGPMTVLEAIQRSINTVAVQVGAAVGPNHVIQYAHNLGVTTPLEPGLPLALGASAVRPIDLCTAYAAFANRGVRVDPVMITAIVDAHGHALWQDHVADRTHPALIKQRALDQINVALREVVTHGTADAAADIPDAHGKTGTTSDHRDAWFVGYTGDLATAVWVAHEQRSTRQMQPGVRRTETRYAPMSDATGGSLCVPIWHDFMRDVFAGGYHNPDRAKMTFRLVVAPTREALIAQLRVAASHLAAASRAARGGTGASVPQDAIGVQPAAFVAAQDGSGPITVTAPVESTRSDQESDTATDNAPGSARACAGSGRAAGDRRL